MNLRSWYNQAAGYFSYKHNFQCELPKACFPLRPYRTVMYRWACADWKEVYKSTYFRVYSRIKIKSSSEVNFLAYYGSTNQSTFPKFWNLKTFSLRYGTIRLKWKTALTEPTIDAVIATISSQTIVTSNSKYRKCDNLRMKRNTNNL
jgi:hypothetical protein